jgi:hypothetical protein
LRGTKDAGALVSWFKQRFSPENFLLVWNFMNGYINVTSSSSQGQYFCKSISPSSSLAIYVNKQPGLYANLAAQTKLYLDDRSPSSRKILLDFYDVLPLAPELKDIVRSDFHEMQTRFYRQKRSRKAPVSALSLFKSIGNAPARSS